MSNFNWKTSFIRFIDVDFKKKLAALNAFCIMQEYIEICHLKKSHKKAHSSPKPLSIERPGQRRDAEPSPQGLMTQQRSAAAIS